jgi:hypothetical protein
LGGWPPKVRQDLVQRIIEMATQQKPTSATHWSTRILAGCAWDESLAAQSSLARPRVETTPVPDLQGE